MRILWIKTGPLHPLDTGGKLRTYHMLREVCREHEVTYLSLAPDGVPREILNAATEYSQKQVWVNWRETPKRTPAFYAELTRNALFSRRPYVIDKYASPALLEHIQRLDRSGEYDLIVCDFLTLAGTLIEARPTTPTLLFQHNVEAVIWRRMARNSAGLKGIYFGDQWNRMRRFEEAMCERFNGVVAVSEADCSALRDEYSLRNVLGSVPTGVDLDYFQAIEHASEAGAILFLGSMDWMPNIDGLHWFRTDIWPKIKAGRPDASLSVVGRNPAPEVRAHASEDPSIIVTGTVPDVRPFLSRASALVVPLRVGGGTRIKIYEAMAAGVPVISTRIGAEGLATCHEQNILLADTPEEFAASTVRVLNDRPLANRLASNAFALVRERFSWKSVTEIFIGYCSSICKRRPPQPQ